MDTYRDLVFTSFSVIHMGLWCSHVFHGCICGYGVHVLFIYAHWALVFKKLVTMPYDASLL